MSDCLFCSIISGSIPSHKLYEDDRVMAILDINPVREGHALVIPKIHAQDASVSDPTDLAAVFTAVGKLLPAMRAALASEGFNVTANLGAAAGQVIFHTHFHIIPRQTGDGLKLWAHVGATQEQLEATRSKIVSRLL